MYFEPNDIAALYKVMMSHLVLHMSDTRKYVMAALTLIQGKLKLCDKVDLWNDMQGNR